MSVIVELSLPAEAFKAGQVLAIEGDTELSLETMIPIGDQPIPFFRLFGPAREDFEDHIRAHPAVNEIHAVNTHDGETLYALDWEIAGDPFFEGLLALDVVLLEATGRAQTWTFELRFPSHDKVSEFQEHCAETDIPLDINKIYNPTNPEAGPWFGLTEPQREMLIRAVEAGYYSIPRRISTEDLANEFDISDTAVTERLRRGIETLTTNTLLPSDSA